jgi:ADP-heptose:LPS heptosyltransferase
LKRVLIIRCGALGDLVYATSVIDALKMEFGEETLIDFVCTPGSGTLFKNDPRVNRVFPLKHKKIPLFFSSQKKAILKASKEKPYDILINFEFGKQFKSLIENLVADKKIGALIENIAFPNDVVHMVDISKYLFKSIVSIETFNQSFPKVIGTPVHDVIQKYNLPKNYLIISPSNSHQKSSRINYRAWENKSWIKLIEKLAMEITVVIVGNKNEDEFFNKLKPYPKNVIDLVAKTSLSDLIGVIDGASSLIATDTGTAHLASAVNTEVFALIGPTPADVTGPYQSPHNKVHIISVNKECSPCYKTQTMKECKNNLCMKEISVEMVYKEIQLMMFK